MKKIKNLLKTGFLAFAFAMSATGLSSAQEATQGEPLIERIDDWNYICPNANNTTDCFAAFRVFVTETQQPLMELAFGAITKADGTREVQGRVTLVDGILLKPGVVIALENDLSRKLAFDICARGQCVANFTLDQELLANMKSQNNGVIGFKARNGQTQQLPLSLKGFSAVMNKAFGL
ncbi:invasion associated locus B family protein [Kiloniella sp. b19]|uniref:invasion associated locus B family protein n=1 Tax=Kiloniella sp. GXU_MW_B19 TaxID=3141326 RepID=UPI0031D0B3C3